MYNRTSLLSLGMTITLPELAQCVTHRMRMSANHVSARVKGSLRHFHLEHTKIGYGNYIEDFPNEVSLLSFHMKT